ncbi:MAG: TetR/AcrR family transcriptional regulator [Novosphingobium sp.]
MDAARTMFLTDGFDAVGMKQVAEKARVSKGTLYARYASKEALFKAVIERSVADWSAEAASRDPMLKDNIEQRLRHHATTIATWLARPDVLAVQRLVLSVRERFPALADVMRVRGYDYIVDLITCDIREAAARDGRNLRDPAAVARLLVAGITGAHIQERGGVTNAEGGDTEGGGTGGGSGELDAFAQRVVDVIVWGWGAW